MRVLITGGAGFIGSHAAEAAFSRGAERVTVLDDLSTGRRANLAALADRPGFGFERGDVLDPGRVDELVGRHDLVLHLAAAVGVRLVLERPVETIRVNVEGTRNVLAACARHGVRCVAASSSEVYGRSPELPFREDGALLLGATTEPRWSYACSKAMGEWLALAQARETGLDVRIVRFFNVVGPRQLGRYGMVLPNFVRQARSDMPLTVFGDGRQTRCFLHVADAVRAVLDLGESEDARGEVFNVGATREISIEALARLVRRTLRSDSSIVHMPYREAYGMAMTDLARRVPDVSKLERAIGFHPTRHLVDCIRDLADEPAPAQSAIRA